MTLLGADGSKQRRLQNNVSHLVHAERSLSIDQAPILDPIDFKDFFVQRGGKKMPKVVVTDLDAGVARS